MVCQDGGHPPHCNSKSTGANWLHYLEVRRRWHSPILHCNLTAAAPQWELNVSAVGTAGIATHASAMPRAHCSNALILLRAWWRRRFRVIILNFRQSISGIVRRGVSDTFHRHTATASCHWRRLIHAQRRRLASAVSTTRRATDANDVITCKTGDAGTLQCPYGVLVDAVPDTDALTFVALTATYDLITRQEVDTPSRRRWSLQCCRRCFGATAAHDAVVSVATWRRFDIDVKGCHYGRYVVSIPVVPIETMVK